MTRQDAIQLLRKKMNEYGLTGWVAGFDNARRRCGQCRGTEQIITLSEYFIKTAPDTDILNTILHEIAHALVGCGHGHDDVWRSKAIQIGCDGKRCTSRPIIEKTLRTFVGTCQDCGIKLYRFRRLRNGFHKQCQDSPSKGLLIWRRNRISISNQPELEG